MKASVVILAVIIVIVLVLIVRGATNSQKRVKDVPTPVQPPTRPSESFHVEGSNAFSVIDLSPNRDLVSIEISNSRVKTLTLPSSTIQPSHLLLYYVDLDTTLTSIPSNLGSVHIRGLPNTDWPKIWSQIASSPYLRNLEIVDIPVPLDLSMWSAGDIKFSSNGNNFCGGSLELQDVKNLDSIGNITMAPNTTPTSGLCDEGIYIINCDKVQTIGNITAINTLGQMDLDIRQNDDLQSIGDINIDGLGYLKIEGHSLLTTIGHITTERDFGITFNLAFNAFSGPMLSQILEDLDATGFVNGGVDIRFNPGSLFGSLTGSGQAAYLSLQGKGWTILI